ncbi:MAG: aspartate carbamoyltransferase catalytic subunit [Spirochaetes bacterium]|nr:aspartate carbamoyltransferase catalytic subunit [Spirochaetota bacterium]
MAFKHLLGLEELSKTDIESILTSAKSFKEVFTRSVKKVPALIGKTVVNLFFEPSTRTRTSFELAAKRLSADVINFTASGSSVSKGETLIDTAKTIEALASDIIVMRHSESGAASLLSKNVRSSVVNAGDGMHEHPTQGLLDMFTMLEHKGRIEGLNVVIVGDILHSRVARSNIYGLIKLGANVTLCGPPTLVPSFSGLPVRIEYDLTKALENADVVNILRIQRERMDANYFPSLREYTKFFGLTTDKLAHAPKDILIMHPGPMNRGVEIAHEVADCKNSVITEQVTNGVAVRMAVLFLVSGAKEKNFETD